MKALYLSALLLYCLGVAYVLFLYPSKSNNNSDHNQTVVLNNENLPQSHTALEEDKPDISDSRTTALGNRHVIEHQTEMLTRPELLTKKYRNLLMFHADDTMEVNQSRLATLVLAKDESIAKLKVQVLEESDARDSSLKADTTYEFGTKMKARLVPFGESREQNSFDIEAMGPEEQSFGANRKRIIWQWKITPRKTGTQELKLFIQVIEKDGEPVTLPARTISVLIFAKPEGVFTAIGNFFANKWEFLITAICIPIIIAWFTTKLRNRGLPPPPPPPVVSTPTNEKADKAS